MHRGTCFTYPVVQVGDNQYFYFRVGDPPPFYKPDCPERDLMTGEMQAARKVRAKPKGNTYFVQMGRGDSTAPPPEATRAQVQKKISGYVDKAKGMRDILRERGLLNPSLTYTKTNAVFLRFFYYFARYFCFNNFDLTKDKTRSLSDILGSCPDFRNEKSAMAEFAEQLGIVTDATPKGYCEIAGRGIEYCWGKSKLYFRSLLLQIFPMILQATVNPNSTY